MTFLLFVLFLIFASFIIDTIKEQVDNVVKENKRKERRKVQKQIERELGYVIEPYDVVKEEQYYKKLYDAARTSGATNVVDKVEESKSNNPYKKPQNVDLKSTKSFVSEDNGEKEIKTHGDFKNFINEYSTSKGRNLNEVEKVAVRWYNSFEEFIHEAVDETIVSGISHALLKKDMLPKDKDVWVEIVNIINQTYNSEIVDDGIIIFIA